jgi:hypothetical protein
MVIDAPIDRSDQNVIAGLGSLGNQRLDLAQTGGLTAVLAGQIHHHQKLATPLIQRQVLRYGIDSHLHQLSLKNV